MSKKSNLTPVAIAAGTALVTSLASTTVANAAGNPFAMSELSSGYMVAEMAEGKCGGKMKSATEGKCGEGKCGGEMKTTTEGKCGEGKCGGEMKTTTEGKCGGAKATDEAAEAAAGEAKTMKEGKCGEGKCGGNK